MLHARAGLRASGILLERRRLSATSSTDRRFPELVGTGASCRGRALRRLQRRTVRHQVSREIAPQGHQELPGERHDGDPPDAPGRALGARDEPAGEATVRLIAHPESGEFDHGRSDQRVAGLADALVTGSVAARERARRQSRVGSTCLRLTNSR